MAGLTAYHDAMTLHLLGRSMPEKYEAAVAATPGGTLDDGRKPNSTFDSTVKVFRNSYDIYGGDGAGFGAQDSFACHMNPFIQNDIRMFAGSITSGGVAVNETIVPASILALAMWYRVIGKCMRFVPTQNLDSRAGTLIAAKNSAPILGSNYDTLAEVRQIPWAREGQADGGIHVDLAHGPIDHRVMVFVNGGGAATAYDSNFTINQIWDPDTFHWRNPGELETVFANDGSTNQALPVNAGGPAVNQLMLQTTGSCIIVGSGFDVGGLSNVHLGRLETVAIYDMVNYSQIWQQKPITVAKVPSSTAARDVANHSDLQYIVNKAEGAGGWLAKNWKGIASTAVSIGDTLATGASILGVPGAGALSAATGLLGGLF